MPTGTVVTPGYFSTLKIPLVAGRDFADADRADTPSAANETAARRFWPGQPIDAAVGKSILQQGSHPGAPDATRTLTVVAIARDSKYRSLVEEPRLFVYVPFEQHYRSRMTIVARSTRGQRLALETRKLLASLDPNLPIVAAQTLEENAALNLMPQRVAASVSGSLGIVGLLLAAIGIDGVTAYMVSSRTREIGIATDADWIAAGRDVFDSMHLQEFRTADPRAFAWADDPDLAAHQQVTVAKDGTIPGTRWLVDHDGELKLTLAECSGCHSRLLADGTVVRGAQMNLNFGSLAQVCFDESKEISSRESRLRPPNDVAYESYRVPGSATTSTPG